MMSRPPSNPVSVAIACGGTGGHLFPGIAVGQRLHERGCKVQLLISTKEVDRQGARNVRDLEVLTLPAIGLSRGSEIAFLRAFVKSYRLTARLFRQQAPAAVLAMGGFTSAPPVLAGRRAGALTFLHESNTVPGRANRWLSYVVHAAFVGFPGSKARLHTKNVICSGTPVRPQFTARDAEAARSAFGLDAHQPVLLIMGGSQGAGGINALAKDALPTLAQTNPELQFLHLAGPTDAKALNEAYASSGRRAVVLPFCDQMELALSAATLAISRAGASSLAELAAVGVPSVLIPFPAATDDHQLHNARQFTEKGAAVLLEQKAATPAALAALVSKLLADTDGRERMTRAVFGFHAPEAAQVICRTIMAELEARNAAAASTMKHPHSAVA